MMLPLELSDRDIKSWVVCVDGVEVAFHATGVPEPARALRT